MKTLFIALLLNPFLFFTTLEQEEEISDLLGVWIRVNARDGEISRAIITEDARGIKLQLFVMQISVVDNSLYEEFRGAVYLEKKVSKSGTFYFAGLFDDIQVAIRPQLIKGMLNLKTSQNTIDRGKRNVLLNERRPEVVTENYLLNRAGNIATEGMISRENASASITLQNDTPYSMDIYQLTTDGQSNYIRTLQPNETSVLNGTRQDEWMVYSRYSLQELGRIRPTGTLQQIKISQMLSPGRSTNTSSTYEETLNRLNSPSTSIPSPNYTPTTPSTNTYSVPSNDFSTSSNIYESNPDPGITSFPSTSSPSRSNEFSNDDSYSSFDNLRNTPPRDDYTRERNYSSATDYDRNYNRSDFNTSNNTSFDSSPLTNPNAGKRVTVKVYNNSRRNVDLYTFDQDGKTIKISGMRPGSSLSQNSIIGQIWIIRDAKTNEELERHVTSDKDRQPFFAKN